MNWLETKDVIISSDKTEMISGNKTEIVNN